MADLSELIAKLEAAETGSRELDGIYAVQVSDGELTESDSTGWVRGPNYIGAAPPYTTSLGAIVALASRRGFYLRSEPRFHIDGERVDFVSYALRPRWAEWRPDDEWFDRGEGRHKDQELSAALALLRALQSQETDHG